MQKPIAILCLFLCLCPLVFAIQWSTEQWTNLGYVPNSATDVVARTVHVKTLFLANTTAGALTVTLVDKSTNCGGAGCQFWPTVSIAANSVYTADLMDVQATGGFTWQASAANSVVGWTYYRY